MATWPAVASRSRGWWDEPARTAQTADRAVHLVLVDGRLVETWSEPVEGTRWEQPRPDLQRPVVQLAEDPHEQTLTWLTDLCGSRAALDVLGDAALRTHETDVAPPELEALLSGSIANLFDAEVVLAMRRLSTLIGEGPGSPLTTSTPQQVIAGVAWAIGKANGLFAPGTLTQITVQHALGLASSIAGAGRAVEREVVGHLVWRHRPPAGAPDLLPLGRPELLTSCTRRTLIAWRDRARDGQQRAEGRHPCTACSPLN